MSSRIMEQYCIEGQKLIGKALLMDYRLAFTRQSQQWGAGVADIVPSRGHSVWGVLYKINKLCLMSLDLKESYGIGYTRIACKVFLEDGTKLPAITYTVIRKLSREVAPSRDYHDTIIEGAEENGLPMEYLDFLRNIRSDR
ncbi:MAG: gamma-glutamylcyclotransferase [Anaerolineae bacterium]|nr:gamma-glutamylcyclotransferase [Anaerolineae bacterium]